MLSQEVGNKEKLIDYICAGPLADKVGICIECLPFDGTCSKKN